MCLLHSCFLPESNHAFTQICVLFYLILYIHATSPEKLQLVFGLGILGYFLLSLLTVLVVFLRVGVEGGSLGLVYASLASGVRGR